MVKPGSAGVVISALWLATGFATASQPDTATSFIADLDKQIAATTAGTRPALKLEWLKQRAVLLQQRVCRTDGAGAATAAKPPSRDCARALASLVELQKAVAIQKDTELDDGAISELAAGAQVKLDKLRLKAKDALERGDSGTATAIDLPAYDDLGSGAGKAKVQARARIWARDAQSKPRELRQAIALAQDEADELVDMALDRRECGRDDRACIDRQVARGQVAQSALELQLAKAEAADKALSEAKLGLQSLKAKPRSEDQDLKTDVAFRALLDSNPDVKSFFGGGAVGFSAGAADSTVTLRYAIDQDGSWLGRRNRLSLIFTAPTNKDGVTNFVSSGADALRNLTSAKLAWQLTNAPFVLPGTGTLNDFAVGLSVAQDTRKYYVLDPTNPTKPNETSNSFTVPGLSIKWAFLANPTKAWKTLLVFGHDTQRGYKNGVSETRCPTDPAATAPALVSCYTGVWGAPTRQTTQLVGLELRQHMPAFDLGLKVKQNLKNDKVDAEIPIYLIRNIPDQAEKTPFTAGVSLSRSTGDKGVKWGLFVSAPLSFGKPDR
jgi:hypothetical protein